jgi:lipopolysaccharide export LptBFGC system permease protein LptF
VQWHGWNAHFEAGELRELLDVYRSRRPTVAEHAQAVDRLTLLYLMREEAGRDRRARAALKYQYLTRLAPVLLVLLVGLGVAVNFATKGNFLETILLTACAGALGSTLSGVFKVRDQLVRLNELRGFWPAMRVQPIVGACAGLIVFLILDSKAIELGAGSSVTWSGRGVLAFAAGFSEPFFLGIVQRVAVVSDRQAEHPKAT